MEPTACVGSIVNPDRIDLMVFVFLILVITMWFYFKAARTYTIIDLPNHRSSHTGNTPIRGGGIVIYVSVILYSIISGFNHLHLIIGISLIAFISFLDDLNSVSRLIRMMVHILSLFLISLDLLNGFPQWIFVVFLILSTGILNAYNFMDGINGMSGIYSLILCGTLLHINQDTTFIDERLMLYPLIGLGIFGYFNFRKNAVCFMGDVGSISTAFLIIYLLTTLILTTKDLSFILLLIVYGIDSVTTIIERLLNGENIFTAHRKHLYQYLSNELGFSHLYVALSFGVIQLIVNIIVLINYQVWKLPFLYLSICILVPLMISYLYLKQICFDKIRENANHNSL